MEEDYFTHVQEVKLSPGCCDGCAGTYLDLSNSSVETGNQVLSTQSGVYSAYVFSREAQRLMHAHVKNFASQPVFFYLPFQSVHGPMEVPASYSDLYNGTESPHYIATSGRRTHQVRHTTFIRALFIIRQLLMILSVSWHFRGWSPLWMRRLGI